MAEVAVGLAIMLLAGLVQGCTGFGLALMAAPCLMLVLPPTAAVPTLVLLSTLGTFLLTLHAWRHVRLGLVAPLAAGGIAGFPLGIYALKAMDPALLKVFVGAFVVLFSLALLAGWSRPLRNVKGALFPVGLAGGFLGGSTSMGGPPVILFLTNQNMPKDVFRGNIVCYFFTVNCFGIAMFLASGLLTWRVAQYAGAFVPTMLVGTYLGVRLSQRLPEARFRRLAMTATATMGAVLLVSSIRALA